MKEKHCIICKEMFHCDDNVIIVNLDIYHKECVQIYPSGYVVYNEGEFLGETESDDGSLAFEHLDFD